MVVFEVSGVIDLQGDLVISSPNITIAGQTAPPPGITLKNAGIAVYASDVLIQHIAARPGNLLPPLGNRDAIKIGATSGNTVERVVIDHVSCSWGIDETLSIWSDHGTVSDVTVSNSIFAHPVINGGLSSGSAGYGPLSGRNVSNVTMLRNIMAFNLGRNPLVRDTTSGAQIVNNFVYRPGVWPNGVMYFGDLTLSPHAVSVIGNVIKRHPIPFTLDIYNHDTQQIEPFTYTTYYNTAIYVHDVVDPDAAFYLADNRLFNPQNSTWLPTDGNPYSSVIFRNSPANPVSQLGSDPYANSGGTSWTPWPSNQVEANLLASAGKQAAFRDSLDASLINDIQSEGGQFLEYFSDLGSDPWDVVDVQNSRSLTLPTTNWSQDSDGDGYTDIEEWLHEWAAIVEGGGGSDPEVVVTDDFEDGLADGWTEYGTHNWHVTQVAGNRVYRQDDTATAAVSILEGTDWDDYTIEARARILGFSTTNSSLISLYARHQDAQNYYTYMLLSDGAGNTVAAIKKRVDNTVIQIGSTVPYQVSENTWYTLKFEVSGTTLTGYVNGTPVITRTDSAFSSGTAGLNTWRASADFDDVVATPAGAASSYEENFNDGQAQGWSTVVGTWGVSSGVYAQTGNHYPDIAVYDGRLWQTDFTYSAKLYTSWSASGNRLGLVYNYEDADNYCYVLVNADGLVEMKRVTSGGTPVVVDSDTYPGGSGVLDDEWFDLSVVRSGNSTTVLLNGMPILSNVSQSGLGAGKIGLISRFNASAKFDDIFATDN